MVSNEIPPGHWASYPNGTSIGFSQPLNNPYGDALPNVGATLPGVADLRDVIRFDVNPAWVTQSFPRVTTVLAETRMDGLRVPFISGTKPTDIAGSLSYYFDSAQTLRRIQFHGTTGDPSMLVALMTQFYRLQAESSVGGHLYTTRWNNRITSVMRLSPAPVIYSHELNNRYQVFLELNQPSNDYGLTLEPSNCCKPAVPINNGRSMNDYLSAVVLGIVEGLTEFLPVSSTAHIRFAQEFLGQDSEDEYWKMFAVVIQLGAILSVLVYFRRRIVDFLLDFWRQASGTNASSSTPKKPLWQHPVALVLLAFVVTAVPCFLIDKKIGEHLENLQLMSWALIIGGIAMYLIDWYCSRRVTTETMDNITWRQAIFIGFAQILAAAFPGTSRSMSTIAGGQIVGLSRPAALEFSFFLSIPVMFAATGFKLLQFVLKSNVDLTSEKWITLAIGFGVSFVVAIAVIAWFMSWVRKQGFLPFAIYRIIAGVAILLWLKK